MDNPFLTAIQGTTQTATAPQPSSSPSQSNPFLDAISGTQATQPRGNPVPVANPNVPTQNWNGQQVPSNIPTKNLLSYDSSTGNKTFKLPDFAGGGVYTTDKNNNIVKGGHTTYGGVQPVAGQQRDDIIPQGLGGANSQAGNIRLVPNATATQQDKVETNLSKQVKSGQVQPKAAITSALSQKAQIANSPSWFQSLKNVASNVGSGLKTGAAMIANAPSDAMNGLMDSGVLNKATQAVFPSSPQTSVARNMLSSIAENLPFGWGQVVQNAENMSGQDLANLNKTTAGELAKFSGQATLKTAQGFASAPVRIAAQVKQSFGGSSDINLPGLGKSNSYSGEVKQAMDNGVPAWLAVMQQVPNIIFDTLMTAGIAQKAVSPTESTILTGNKKAAIQSNVVGTPEASFRETAQVKPTYVPISADNPAGAEVHSALEGTPKYNSANPTFLKVEATPQGFKGSIVQIKPSLLEQGYNKLFGADGKPTDPKVVSNGEITVQGGTLPKADLAQIKPPIISLPPTQIPAQQFANPNVNPALQQTSTQTYANPGVAKNLALAEQAKAPTEAAIMPKTTPETAIVPNRTVQVVSPTGAKTYYTIPQNESKTIIDKIDNSGGTVAQNEQGNFHVTAKTPAQMEAQGFKSGGSITADKIPEPLKPSKESQAGFVSPSEIGKSIKGKITSAKDLIAQTKIGLTASSNLEDSLFKIKQAAKADKLQASEMIKNSPMTNQDAEAIYHYQENNSEPLTPKQQELYQSEIKPLADESARIVAKLKPLIPINENTYTPRFVKGKGGVIDRMLDKGRASFGSTLSKAAPSLTKRTMKVLVDDKGNRTVASIKQGKVTQLINKKGTYLGATTSVANKALGDKSQFIAKDGKTYQIEQATTKEIEQHTNLTYHHNALVNNTINYLKLRQAERAVDFLEAYKESPEFKTIAVKFGEGLAPDGWRPSSLRTFSGYVFEPHVAAVLDGFNKSLQSGADPLKILTAVNSFLRTSIFFNPLIHVPNIMNHWFVARGVTPFANPKAYGRLITTSVKAINAVLRQNSDYTDMLKQGANLLYADENVKNLNALLLQKMSTNIETDPQLKFFREAFPNFIKWLNPYKLSGKITWAVNDIATMQSVYENMTNGMTMGKAIQETGKHIPNYRVPANVLGSEAVSKFLKNPNITMFSAYHYGALKSYVETAKDLGSGDIKKTGDALNRLAMLALITLVLYPQLDKLAKKITGNANAQFRRAGASTLVYQTGQLMQGKIDAGQFLTTFLTPAPATKETIQQVFNTDLFTGQKIRTPGQTAGTQLKESATHAGLQVSPIQQYQRVTTGSVSGKDYVSSLFGISSPKSTPTEKIIQSMIYDEKIKLQAQLKPLVASGKTAEAQKLVNDFNNRLKEATIQALKDKNQSTSNVDAQLKAQYIKLPGVKAMQNYNSGKGKTPLQKILK